MDQEKKDLTQKKLDMFNLTLFWMQLFYPATRPITFQDFLDEFKNHMTVSYGECTEEDEEWAFQNLIQMEKRAEARSKKEEKKSRKSTSK